MRILILLLFFSLLHSGEKPSADPDTVGQGLLASLNQMNKDIEAGRAESARRIKALLLKRNTCAQKPKGLMNAALSMHGPCSCIYECTAKRKDEILDDSTQNSMTTEYLTEALGFCEWASDRIPGFEEYKSVELSDIVVSNCMRTKCRKWYIEMEPVLTSTIIKLTAGTPIKVLDTLKTCYPNMVQIYDEYIKKISSSVPETDGH